MRRNTAKRSDLRYDEQRSGRLADGDIGVNAKDGARLQLITVCTVFPVPRMYAVGMIANKQGVQWLRCPGFGLKGALAPKAGAVRGGCDKWNCFEPPGSGSGSGAARI